MTFSTDSSPSSLEWKFSQVFGERSPGEEIQEIDVISAIEFDTSGDHLAVGDRGGRVVIFERKDGENEATERHSRKELEQLEFTVRVHPEYQYNTEFQSHEPEFDCLNSVEIKEKINKVKWCTTPNGSLFILSTNDKTIKLWKVEEHKLKKLKAVDLNPFVSSENTLLSERSFISGLPKLSHANGYFLDWTNKMERSTPSSDVAHSNVRSFEDGPPARCRKVYARAHEFNINSLSNNSDGETFVSADDLRINLWNLEVSDQCFNIVDRKPSNMDDLTEVITSAEFHPHYCNLLAYGSSRGFIRLVDMRQSALCDHGAKILYDGEGRSPKTFFTEIIAAISDIKFATDGRHILSRDYMNLKLWDMRMPRFPVATYWIHEHLRPRLCDLYNDDVIFDKFGCCLSRDGHHFATGTYDNHMRMFTDGVGSEEGITLEASRNSYRKQPQRSAPRRRRSSLSNLTLGLYRQGRENSNSGSNELGSTLKSKVLHVAWHPSTNLIACSAENSLFMFYA